MLSVQAGNIDDLYSGLTSTCFRRGSGWTICTVEVVLPAAWVERGHIVWHHRLYRRSLGSFLAVSAEISTRATRVTGKSKGHLKMRGEVARFVPSILGSQS